MSSSADGTMNGTYVADIAGQGEARDRDLYIGMVEEIVDAALRGGMTHLPPYRLVRYAVEVVSAIEGAAQSKFAKPIIEKPEPEL